MTAAIAPASQLTFAPRTVASAAEVAPVAVERPELRLVPADGIVDPAPLATVHRLPVRHQAGVYRRRRLTALAVVIGLVLALVSFMQQADATPTPEGQLAESVTVIVQPGDTLWGIAGELDPSGDTRALVDRLSALADAGSLQPGQQLVVPGHWLD